MRVQGLAPVGPAVRGFAVGLLCLLPLAALAQGQPVATASDVAVRGVVIPTGYLGNKYSAMIQIAVEGSPLPDATWDLAASLTANGTEQTFSGRVVAGKPGAPVVLEAEVQFTPGPYTLTLEARETTAGQAGTRKREGRWPDPRQSPATISPIILLQPQAGAFVRGESARRQGALARGAGDPARTQLPTALISVVCRGSGLPDLVRVERRLDDETADFKPIHLLPGGEQCAQVRDLIGPGVLRVGRVKYEVLLITTDGTIASEVLEFDAVSGDSPG